MIRQPLFAKQIISQLVELHIKQKAPQMRCINIIISQESVQIKRKETP